MHLDVPPGVAKVPVLGLELQKLALAFTRPLLFRTRRFEISGVENIPARARHPVWQPPQLLRRGVHRSRHCKSGRTVRFLGKKEVSTRRSWADRGSDGGIRVERGTGNDEPLKAAADALAAGDMVAIMPQGTIPRGMAFFDPVLKAVGAPRAWPR